VPRLVAAHSLLVFVSPDTIDPYLIIPSSFLFLFPMTPHPSSPKAKSKPTFLSTSGKDSAPPPLKHTFAPHYPPPASTFSLFP